MPSVDHSLKVFLCHAHADRDPVRALPAGTRLTKDGVDAWLTRRGIGNPRLSTRKPCGLGTSPKGLPRTEQGISIPLTHAHADRDPVRALYTRLNKDGVDAWLTRRGIGNPRLSIRKPCGLGTSPKGLPRTEQGISIPLTHAHADRDPVRGLYTRLAKDGVDAWLDKAKPCGE